MEHCLPGPWPSCWEGKYSVGAPMPLNERRPSLQAEEGGRRKRPCRPRPALHAPSLLPYQQFHHKGHISRRIW